MPSPLHHLPEPAALHAELSRQHPLDWGDPLPTKAELAAAFGPHATTRALDLLQSAAGRHDRVTAALISAIPPGDHAHQLDHRVKAPDSLARKFWTAAERNRPALTDDVLRFTVLASSPDTLVDSTRATVGRLVAQGWTVDSAHHSYVDQSRYKGVHVIMRDPGRQQVEVQFHSPESAQVKALTTRLYEIERDPRQPRQQREQARRECVRLSAAMALPAGIERFTELHGTPVAARCYGRRANPRAERPAAAQTVSSNVVEAGRIAGTDSSTVVRAGSVAERSSRVARFPRRGGQDGRMIT
ncbi:hypothetical protein [Kribbella deserti]|uniref:RelA/SpoT domain-containing protein n=1 Tax=Kribbella deserti TaxID=1926257 RepID=A0ABV6QWT2_9ACTN